jgi:predicted AAA+ superfamily ATPase
MALLCEVHYTLGNETSKTTSTYVEMVESFFKELKQRTKDTHSVMIMIEL